MKNGALGWGFVRLEDILNNEAVERRHPKSFLNRGFVG